MVKRIQQRFDLDGWRFEGELNQLARGTLNRYLLILKRLIFESSVFAGIVHIRFVQAADGAFTPSSLDISTFPRTPSTGQSA